MRPRGVHIDVGYKSLILHDAKLRTGELIATLFDIADLGWRGVPQTQPGGLFSSVPFVASHLKSRGIRLSRWSEKAAKALRQIAGYTPSVRAMLSRIKLKKA